VGNYIEVTNRWVDDSSTRNTNLRHFVTLKMRLQGLTLVGPPSFSRVCGAPLTN
ncbi:hypothetical protein CROQUDRAFT_39184, partial [Cronartium quercuum f. sp. fusiforme G11]